MGISRHIKVLLSLITAAAAMSPFNPSLTYCETDPELQRMLLFSCFLEQGFSQVESTSLFTVNLEFICRMHVEFINAIKCQIRYLKRCSPETAQMVPSVESTGIPNYLNGVCNTEDFNATCYDERKSDLNACTRSSLQQTMQQLGPDQDACHLMTVHAADCAKTTLADCGDVTVATVVKFLPSTRPSKCLTGRN
ncbi:unnamed protein product [Lymnaea stagnalis]|uniref:Uncharacterized protein n=1 Tax=Lymnaea stagnalis TaxID=6523 RepID=A0AAV2HMM1_LYMST